MNGELGETVVFIGFPITILAIYLPEDAHAATNEDKSVVVTLPPSVFQESDDIEKKKEEFRNWKDNVPMAQAKKRSLSDDLKSNAEKQPHRISEVMLRILAFPVEQKTPMECMGFESSISALANLRFRRRHSRLEKQLRSKEFLLEIHEIHPFLRSGQGGVEPSQILCFKRFF